MVVIKQAKKRFVVANWWLFSVKLSIITSELEVQWFFNSNKSISQLHFSLWSLSAFSTTYDGTLTQKKLQYFSDTTNSANWHWCCQSKPTLNHGLPSEHPAIFQRNQEAANSHRKYQLIHPLVGETGLGGRSVVQHHGENLAADTQPSKQKMRT